VLSQAIILAGGRGTRLGNVTKTVPKPMIEVGGRPFLETILLNLKYYGFKKIILSVGYLADIISDYFGDGSRHGLDICYVSEETPAGTGGVFALCREKLDDCFLVLNGDTIFDVNYYDLYQLFKESGASGAVALREVEDTGRYGAIELNGEQLVRFDEKGKNGRGLVNGGVYIFSKTIIQYVDRIPYSIEKDLMPRLIQTHSLVARPYHGFFIDMGMPESLDRAYEQVPIWWHKPIVFLDRDGVINKDNGYVCTADRFEWVNGAPEAIRMLNEYGYRVVIVTNQAGIARGYYSEAQFLTFMDWMQEKLKGMRAHIDAIYYCPHHPDKGQGAYKQQCECRKPEPGLLLQAIDKFQPELEQSFLIGDKESDLQAAYRIGLTAYQFNENWDLLNFIKGIIQN
jgi:D-glycero-D-manno-heptose 1,7-bisphosphate phosphatase